MLIIIHKSKMKLFIIQKNSNLIIRINQTSRITNKKKKVRKKQI